MHVRLSQTRDQLIAVSYLKVQRYRALLDSYYRLGFDKLDFRNCSFYTYLELIN